MAVFLRNGLKHLPRLAMVATIGLFLMPLAVRAGTKSAAIDVSASVPGACSLTSTTPSLISYDYIVTNATTDLTELLGTLTMTCTKNTTAVFGPDHGRNGTVSGSAYQNRLYSFGSDAYLNYALYQDSGYTKVFGTTSTDGTTTGLTESLPITAGTPGSINVYLKIPAGQQVPVGDYTDQVDFTVTY